MKAPDPSRERPTIAALLTAFLTAAVGWGFDYLPDTVPTEVAGTGFVLAIATVAVAVGKAAQGQWLKGWLGATAPWAHDTHHAAVAYAITLDPAAHGPESDELIRKLGVDGYADALHTIGVDPGDA